MHWNDCAQAEARKTEGRCEGPGSAIVGERARGWLGRASFAPALFSADEDLILRPAYVLHRPFLAAWHYPHTGGRTRDECGRSSWPVGAQHCAILASRKNREGANTMRSVFGKYGVLARTCIRGTSDGPSRTCKIKCFGFLHFRIFPRAGTTTPTATKTGYAHPPSQTAKTARTARSVSFWPPIKNGAGRNGIEQMKTELRDEDARNLARLQRPAQQMPDGATSRRPGRQWRQRWSQ